MEPDLIAGEKLAGAHDNGWTQPLVTRLLEAELQRRPRRQRSNHRGEKHPAKRTGPCTWPSPRYEA
jgi:hypothetical protein